jgi:hypothetical protein
MKKRWIVGLALLAGVVVLLAATGEFTTERVRQRVTIEIATPGGVRSASGVSEVSSTHQTLVGASIARARGEAIFVDMGGGRHVIALLASGPKAEGVDWLLYLHRLVLPKRGGTNEEEMAASRHEQGRVVDLPAHTLPTLVTFADVANPASARVVEPTAEGFAAVFGPGNALRRATVEMVPAGWWPLSLIPAPWPKWLFGTPITRAIEGRLPVTMGKLLAQSKISGQVEHPYDAYRAKAGQFMRGF